MNIYYFESKSRKYICTGYNCYAPDRPEGALYSFQNFHQVKRKPTLSEAVQLYSLLPVKGNLSGTSCDAEPELLIDVGDVADEW